MGDVILTIDEASRICFANEAVRRVFGYSPEELLGQPITCLMPERLRARHERSLDAYLASGSRHLDWRGVNLTGLARDGSEIALEVSFGEFARDGRRYFTGVLRDIRSRKQFEEALRVSEEKYRFLVEKSLGLICSHDLEGNLLDVNPAAAHALGYEPEELRGRNLSDLLVPELRHLLGDYLRTFPARKSDAGLMRILTRDGEVRVWSFHNSLSEVPGRPPCVIGNARDVTDEVRDREALRTAFSLLEATLESTADGILVVDLRGRITRFNGRFAEMWRIDESILAARDDDSAIRAVLDQLKDAEGFLARVVELYSRPEAESFDVLEFLDGRVFERYSRPQRLEGDVVGRVWSFRDVTERRRSELRIARQAYHDALTGLPNRLLIQDRLSVALAFARRQRQSLAVLFLDLDDFKTVNDTLGHGAGDELLKVVAERLQGTVREGDTVGRLAGDEFVILLPEVSSADDAGWVAAKLLSAVAEPIVVAASEIRVTTSIGISLFPGDGGGVDELLRSADAAMYRAKELGRNTIQLSSPELASRARERLALASGLRGALERGELLLHYQPIFASRSKGIVGVEALLRWQSPGKRLRCAAEFVPAAEESRLIVPIGEWVLRQACAQARQWRSLSPTLRVAINVSARQLQHNGFARLVERLLGESGIEPSQVELELTETVALENVTRAREVLRALRELGVRIAIDDFGAGQTSLGHLRQLPITGLKLDGGLIRNVPADATAASIFAAILAMARAIELEVVAEGVETREQAEYLADLGCDGMQGFFLGQPMPPVELAEILRRSSSVDGPASAGGG